MWLFLKNTTFITKCVDTLTTESCFVMWDIKCTYTNEAMTFHFQYVIFPANAWFYTFWATVSTFCNRFWGKRLPDTCGIGNDNADMNVVQRVKTLLVNEDKNAAAVFFHFIIMIIINLFKVYKLKLKFKTKFVTWC